MRKDYEWDAHRQAIRDELGEVEITRRVNALDEYHKWETVVTWHDVSLGGQGMTPRQAAAWALLASSTAIGARVFGGTIKRPLNRDELAFVVVSSELARRADAQLLNLKDTP